MKNEKVATEDIFFEFKFTFHSFKPRLLSKYKFLKYQIRKIQFNTTVWQISWRKKRLNKTFFKKRTFFFKPPEVRGKRTKMQQQYIDEKEDKKQNDALGTENEIQEDENVRVLNIVQEPKEVHLLLIGCTGSGKTTLRMAIRDYLLDKPFEKVVSTVENEEQWYQENGLTRPQLGQVQTTRCIDENFRNREFNVFITDTPGFSGPQDEKDFNSIATHVDKLKFGAVLVVIQATSNRDNEKLKKEIAKLLEILSDDYKRNLFVVVTFSTNRPGEDTLKVIQDLGLESCSCVYMHNVRYQSNFDMSPGSIKLNKSFFADSKQKIYKLLTECSKLSVFQLFYLCLYEYVCVLPTLDFFVHVIHTYNGDGNKIH
ncbi:hypothetical protein RFI_35799 [Reticulomyxa filosa]|uniref:Uncharacterized protein n=1 Tax=Reticulomyxa filosa TaxID=46433 RepID=X6LI51_RETFI|nr:hypothetical protein RFI_35799 [Reticulomyxa filosa]|eukprot:ETO01643.1 hypothetical protein RFI_35799 [Reticulomyxa filosa]